MRYFSELANKNETYTTSRNEVFKQICVARLQGEEKGYIKLDDEILKTIAGNLLDTYGTGEQEAWRTQYAKKISSYTPNQRPYVPLSYEFAALIARDFVKIEKFIETYRDFFKDEETLENDATILKKDLIMAFKGNEHYRIFVDEAGGIFEEDKGRVQCDNDPGYVILNIDGHGVHAEAKMIEYLIFTGIAANLIEGGKIYVGISKLCCKGCDNFVTVVNKIFGSKIEVFYTRGTHGLQPEWIPPVICRDDLIKKKALGYYWSEKEQQYKPILHKNHNMFSKMIKCIYMASSEQMESLSKRAPHLKKDKNSTGTGIYQTAYSDSQTHSHDESDQDNFSSASNKQVIQEFFKRFAHLYDAETRASILTPIKHVVETEAFTITELKNILDEQFEKITGYWCPDEWFELLVSFLNLAPERLQNSYLASSMAKTYGLTEFKRTDQDNELDIRQIIYRCISEGEANIEGSNLCIKKQENTDKVLWYNINGIDNTLEENIILTRIETAAREYGMEIVAVMGTDTF